MLIRKTLPEDVDTILNIFDTARQFMHATGNPTQWNANYPALEDLEPDIQNGNSYVCVENDKVVATFTLIIGDEPNYQLIENGSWRSEAPYGTVHRLASEYFYQQEAFLHLPVLPQVHPAGFPALHTLF